MEIVVCKPELSRLRGEVGRVVFFYLEIRVEGKDYVLTNYESSAFDFHVDTFEILEPNEKFSFMNGREYIVKVKDLFEYKDNMKIFKEAIRPKIIKENRSCFVGTEIMNNVMGGIFKLHENHAEQARINLIDRALVENDKELFERMLRMEVPECK